jgi:hypothetical protein
MRAARLSKAFSGADGDKNADSLQDEENGGDSRGINIGKGVSIVEGKFASGSDLQLRRTISAAAVNPLADLLNEGSDSHATPRDLTEVPRIRWR